MIDGDGDYDGEVELEQAYINYHNADGNWGYGAGVVLISAGIINETHEPPTFLSVERPSYNKYIIPTTWFGNGAMAYGSFGDFHAKFTLHEDMDGSGMVAAEVEEHDGEMHMHYSFDGLRGGRAKGYKSSAYHWTKNLAMHWTGMEGLNVGGSFTFGGAETGLNSVPGRDYVDWNLFEVHGQYEANGVIAAFEYGTTAFSHEADNGLGEEDGTDLVVADQVAAGYYFHVGYDIAPMMGWEDCKLVPWFGMESYDLNDLEAINYHEVIDEDLIDNDLCIYDICTDYITSNQIDCDSSLTAPYELDQNLGCDAANAQLSMCYPEDCDTEFSLSDFEGKIIWIIYEADW